MMVFLRTCRRSFLGALAAIAYIQCDGGMMALNGIGMCNCHAAVVMEKKAGSADDTKRRKYRPQPWPAKPWTCLHIFQ